MVTGVRDVGNKRILMKNKNLCLLNLHQNPTPLTRHASWCSKNCLYWTPTYFFGRRCCQKPHAKFHQTKPRNTSQRAACRSLEKSTRSFAGFSTAKILINCQTSTIASNVLIEVLAQDFLDCQQVRMLFSTRGNPSVCLASYTPPVAPVSASE